MLQNARKAPYVFLKVTYVTEKRVLLDSIKGRLGVIFQTPPNMSTKKACLTGKFWGKIARNGVLGKSLLGYVLKTSGHTHIDFLQIYVFVTHWIFLKKTHLKLLMTCMTVLYRLLMVLLFQIVIICIFVLCYAPRNRLVWIDCAL